VFWGTPDIKIWHILISKDFLVFTDGSKRSLHVDGAEVKILRGILLVSGMQHENSSVCHAGYGKGIE
jgi:hypothetical protein